MTRNSLFKPEIRASVWFGVMLLVALFYFVNPLLGQYSETTPVYWFSPESGVELSADTVISWHSIDSLSALNQPSSGSRPFLIENDIQLAGHNAIQFNGDQFLSMPVSIPQPNTIISVFRPTGNAPMFLYDMTSRLFLLCHPQNGIIPASIPSFPTPIPKDHFIITTHVVEEGEARFYENAELKSEGTEPRIINGTMHVGMSAFNDRLLVGKVAELIIYDTALSEAEMLIVFDSLKAKYAPPPVLPAQINILPDCSRTLSVDDRFKSYTWFRITETGDEELGNNESQLEVTQPGEYILETLSMFGDLFRDTVSIIEIEPPVLSATVCEGQPFSLDLNIIDADITIQWSDSSLMGSVVSISEPGIFSMVISQPNGCSIAYSIEVTDIATVAEIGFTEPFCAGNPLQLNEVDGVSILWSTGSQSTSIVPDGEGLYWVEVQNENGCVASDSVTVIFAGLAPLANYSSDLLCEQETISFVSQSESADDSEIVLTEWLINGEYMEGAEVDFFFPENESYSLQLWVTTSAGCSALLNDSLIIHPKPEINFNHALPCTNSPTLFEDESTIASGDLTAWYWDFGSDNTADTPIALAFFDNPGVHNISLQVTSNQGCTDAILAEIGVYPTPIANFVWEPTCQETPMNLVSTTDTSLTGSVHYAWNISGMVNTGPSVNYTFSTPGQYQVQHEVWTTIEGAAGCFNQQTQTVIVTAVPEVQFVHTPACVGEEVIIADATIPDLADEVVSWQWSAAGLPLDTLPSFMWQFNESGVYLLTLAIATQSGCAAVATDAIIVGEGIPPVISHTPEIGLPPLAVSFFNETSYGQFHLWDFGDGGFSTEESPQHTYLDTGQYEVQVTVEDEAGCTGFATTTVDVRAPYFDVAVEQVSVVKQNSLLSVSCIIANYNNHTLRSALLTVKLGNGTLVSEPWSGSLDRNQLTEFTFSSLLNVDDEINDSYVCVEIRQPDVSDFNPENNRKCTAIGSESFEMFKPFPNPAKEYTEQWFYVDQPSEIAIRMVSTSGKILFETQAHYPKGLHQVRMQTGNFAPGIYIIQLKWNGHMHHKKLMVSNRNE